MAELERELGFDSTDEEYSETEVLDENGEFDDLTESEREKIRTQMEADELLMQENLEKINIENEEPKLSKKAKKRLKQRQKEQEESVPAPAELPAESPAETENPENSPEIPKVENATPEKKISGKEKRRQREKQRQEEAAKRKAETKKLELDCKICKEEFESRTQLFKHIKEV